MATGYRLLWGMDRTTCLAGLLALGGGFRKVPIAEVREVRAGGPSIQGALDRDDTTKPCR